MSCARWRSRVRRAIRSAIGAEGLGQETEGVQGLNPLAVEHVGLVARRKAAGEVAADEAAMDAPLLQHHEQGDPIDAGGFHGDGLDAVLDQPIGQGVEVGGVGAEGTHDLGLVGAGDADVNLLCADVSPGGVGVDDGQAFGGADFALGQWLGMGFRASHWGPPEIRMRQARPPG